MYKLLNYYWRILATGLCFVVFGLGSIVLSLVVFPLQKVFIYEVEKRKVLARKTVHYTFKYFVSLMSLVGVFSFQLTNIQSLKSLRGYLILANHPSLIDVVVLISVFPNADCVVKTHLFKNIFFRLVFQSTGYINNSDPQGLLDDCKKSLEQGNNIIIFPQGTRSTLEQPLSFKRGAANVAIRCQAKVQSIWLGVTPSTLTKGESWYHIPKKKAVFSAKSLKNTPNVPKFESLLVSKQVRHYNKDLEEFFKKELSQHE